MNHHNWLIGYDSQEFQRITTNFYREISQLPPQNQPRKIILAEPEPIKFIAAFIAACATNSSVFLCPHDWGKQEWNQVFDLVQPDIIWGLETNQFKMPNSQCQIPEILDKNLPASWQPTQVIKPAHADISPTSSSSLIMIPTGGSSGKIKFAMHTWETLTASVTGFTQYFQLKQVNSFCVLPVYHVSGLMQFMRSFTTGGQLIILPFKSIELGQTYQINPQEFFISLVPTQLQRILQNPELTAWLAQFKTVLLGGAPPWQELLEKARFHGIRLAPTYGMTETASQIATLKPEDFLNHQTGSGQILPHAQVKILNSQGQVLQPNQIGSITIQAKSLALGYYPQSWNNQDYFAVDDLGFINEQGYLNIVGRNSDKIISGGENIYPAEVESAIHTTGMVTDVCVIGIQHQDWGQALTAVYIPKNSDITPGEIKSALYNQISKLKIPKYWIPQTDLPRNSQGKINRQKLQQIATEFLQNHLH